jgi:Na+/proline symporter
MPQLATDVPTRLVRLSPVDVVIVSFDFVLVLSVGWYRKGRADPGEDFFMAGREMTAWVAGLSFLSANFIGISLAVNGALILATGIYQVVNPLLHAWSSSTCTLMWGEVRSWR